MVRDVFPAVSPAVGLMLEMLGGVTKIKPLNASDAPAAVLTDKSTGPCACDVVVQIIWVVLLTEQDAPGKVTVVAPIAKPVPLMVTESPPPVEPVGGLTETMTGGPATEVGGATTVSTMEMLLIMVCALVAVN